MVTKLLTRARMESASVRLGTAGLVGVLLLGLSGCGTTVLAGSQTNGEWASQRPASSSMPATSVSTPADEATSAIPAETTQVTPRTLASQPAASAEPTKTASQTPVVTPSRQPALLKRDDTGEKVRELQSRLEQIAWYDAKITDSFGELTQAAVEGFQAKRGLESTGAVDQKTWDALVAMTRMPTHDEMYNILKPGPALLAKGATGDTVRDAQARLKQLDWLTGDVTGTYDAATVKAVTGFQAKREFPQTGEIDQRTLDKLTEMTHKPASWELENKPAPADKGSGSTKAADLDPRCMTGRVMCISKKSRSLKWVVDGKVITSMDVRFGSAYTPTREGLFSVGWKSRDHVSTLFNSPMPFAMFFSGGEAVHYSADFAARGYNGASHGCVNVRDYDTIKWLFNQVKVGDKVVVYR